MCKQCIVLPMANLGVKLLELPDTELVVLVFVKDIKHDFGMLLGEAKLLLEHLVRCVLLQATEVIAHIFVKYLLHIIPVINQTLFINLLWGQ